MRCYATNLWVHSWGEWRRIEIEVMTDSWGQPLKTPFIAARQKRACSSCGLIQQRLI